MNPCCVLLQPHPNTTTSHMLCECGQWWTFEVEWVSTVQGPEPMRHCILNGEHLAENCDTCLILYSFDEQGRRYSIEFLPVGG